MTPTDHLSRPDEHLDPSIAAVYDEAHAHHFGSEVVGPAVDLLFELAAGGPMVEFAVGTGRVALPLVERGATLYGIDFSEPMLAELRRKPGAERVGLTRGDMTTTRACSGAALVYLVFNTLGNLRTQAAQVACFRNAAAHLAPGGRFVIELITPQIHRLPVGETIQANEVSKSYLSFNEYIDPVRQILVSHHYYMDGGKARTLSGAFRYAWPAELDLMAQLAGMELEQRWADWDRSEFTADSPSHISVWRRPQPD